MIFVAVGTFLRGFDSLVQAADAAAARLGIVGEAQIGHGAFVPKHLRYRRFLDPAELHAALQAAALVVTHAGMGLLGDAMRANKRIIVVPRRGRTTADNPANDQMAFACRISKCFALELCPHPDELEPLLARHVTGPTREVHYSLGHDVTSIIARNLGLA